MKAPQAYAKFEATIRILPVVAIFGSLVLISTELFIHDGLGRKDDRYLKVNIRLYVAECARLRVLHVRHCGDFDQPPVCGFKQFEADTFMLIYTYSRLYSAEKSFRPPNCSIQRLVVDGRQKSHDEQ